MDLKKDKFGSDFIWGVSTAAYQIEGAHKYSGKGPSIWDTFVRKKNKIFGNDNADIACNFYHSYTDDIDLMKSMNIKNHRFSISWSRILPAGTGQINQNGIDYYNQLIDHTIAQGITPWITLYHWDLPQALEDRGGWTNRDIVTWFCEYVSICVKNFGDRVNNWIVLNEPTVFTAAGYFFGVHAPGKRGLDNFLAAAHHAALAQSLGAKRIKSIQPDSYIGTTFSCSYVQPLSNREKDVLAAKKADIMLNRLFVEPLLGMGYPTEEIKILRRIERYIKPGDEADLKFNMDFIGIQNYTREIVKHSYFVPFLKAKIVSAKKRKVQLTAMNWEVYPESIYEMLKKFASYTNIPPLIVTENGAAFADRVENNQVHDTERTTYIKQAIGQVLRSKNEGINVKGYFAWTFLDNFEWAEGYRPRFGLVYVDFETQRRIIKSSGIWYADFIK